MGCNLLNTSMYTNLTTSLLSYRRHLSLILYLQITSPLLFWLASNLGMLGHINSSTALGMLAAKIHSTVLMFYLTIFHVK